MRQKAPGFFDNLASTSLHATWLLVCGQGIENNSNHSDLPVFFLPKERRSSVLQSAISRQAAVTSVGSDAPNTT